MKVYCGSTAKTQKQSVVQQQKLRKFCFNIIDQKSFTKACPSSLAKYCLMLGMAKVKRNVSVGSQPAVFWL